MNITFDDNLITGNKTIDSQHQELIDRIRQFVAACESGDSKIKAIKMLDYLDEYTNFHFQEEEELQKKVSYPELSGHHAKHEEFKTSIQELYDYLNENEGPDDQFIEQIKIGFGRIARNNRHEIYICDVRTIKPVFSRQNFCNYIVFDFHRIARYKPVRFDF